jgi:hypothetical protein
VVLPGSLEEIGPLIVEELRRLAGEYGLCGVTVADPGLAARIREALPGLPIVGSVLMDVAEPVQVAMLDDVFDTLVPSSRIMRDRPALDALRSVFPGRVRVIVNEACLPGCVFRVQHFYEMGTSAPAPRSLCDVLLRARPWLRLTGAWVLPQHLHLYDGLYDELKLAGRVTLQDPELYLRVLDAYVHGRPLTPDAIGGGPASVTYPLEVSEEFYRHTLHCGRRCHECDLCRKEWDQGLEHLGMPPAPEEG